MLSTRSTRSVKDELAQRVGVISDPAFIGGRIRPLVGKVPAEAPWTTEVIQLDGTGAATVHVAFGQDGDVYAKLYPGEDGPAIHAKLLALRGDGFGPGSRYRVVEPLAFFPEYRMLVARSAGGIAVSEMIEAGGERLEEGVREAARWLAHLHSTPARIGRPQSLLVSGELLSFARRLSKVVVDRPGHLPVALEMIRRLEDLADETVDGLQVQSHGQFRPIHVFVSPEAVTVIDLDRSRPCDPARDVAEFIHRLRMTIHSRHGSVEPADAPTRAFVETYLDGVAGPEHLHNLRFHWARYIAHSLNNKLKGDESSDPEAAATVDFYRAEFDAVVERRHGIAGGLV